MVHVDLVAHNIAIQNGQHCSMVTILGFLVIAECFRFAKLIQPKVGSTVFWIGLATVQVACIHIVNTSGSNAVLVGQCHVRCEVPIIFIHHFLMVKQACLLVSLGYQRI